MKFTTATELANWLKVNSFTTHRAVVRVASGHLIAFGNDGGDKVDEPGLFCNEIRTRGARIVARGTDDSQYSWVVVFEGRDAALEEYADLLWGVWNRAKGVGAISEKVTAIMRANNGRVAATVAGNEWSG